MHIRRAAALAAFLVLGAGVSAQAGPPKDKFAVFTQKDPGFTETITLYADGRYEQKETQSNTLVYHLGSLHSPAFPVPASPGVWGGIRGGEWHLLDREGGISILYKPGGTFPASAVIELKGAMPFGFVWDNQSPFPMRGDRYLEAGLFQVAAPIVQPTRSGILTPGSPLPPLIKPLSSH